MNAIYSWLQFKHYVQETIAVDGQSRPILLTRTFRSFQFLFLSGINHQRPLYPHRVELRMSYLRQHYIVKHNAEQNRFPF